MGRVQRKTSKYLELYRKRLRKKVLTVLSFTPPAASLNEFIKLFSEIYPDELLSIERHYQFYQEKNKSRSRGKPLYFPSPSKLLYDLAKRNLSRSTFDKWDLLQAKIDKETALADAAIEREKRNVRYRNNNISTQEVTPRYIENLISRYWKEKLKNRRLSIVIECGKFKNEKTVLFFRQVMSGEKDWFIRNYCFQTLQRFDEVVYLPPKGEGKRQQYDYLVNLFGCDYKEDIGRTPKDIIEEFYGDNYIEHTKDFDVFISHAVSNASLVDQLVASLNSAGLVAFVDWKNDRQDLKRCKSSPYTAKVLELRMKQSKSLILVRTKESDSSVWVAWEIGYFTALGKKVAVLRPDDSYEQEAEFLKELPVARYVDGNLRVCENDNLYSIEDWINE
ncbi:TPA: TIR domain-containing protein [Vibrio vulnificus]